MVNNQKGYALLITLILLLLVSMLGIAMMTTNLTAATQNKTREAVVQSEDLAVKGAEFFSASLQNELEKSINSTRLTVPEYINKLKSIIQKNTYQCVNGNIPITTDIVGSTNVCIEKIYIEGNQNPTASQLAESLKWIVVLRSTSIVDGQTKIVRQHIEYGTDNVPDQLRYALSSNNNGNLYLHGGIDIIGDVKSAGNIIISERAFWHNVNSSTGNWSAVNWEASLYPRIMSKQFRPKIILPTDSRYHIYTLKNNNTTSSLNYFQNTHITGSDLNNSNNYTKYDISLPNHLQSLRNTLTDGTSVDVERRELPTDDLDITATIDEAKNIAKYTNLATSVIGSNSNSIYSENKNNSFHFSTTERYCIRYIFIFCAEYGNRTVASNLTLKVGNLNNLLKLKGIYYVTGNLTIEDTFLESDAIFYVNGDVTFRNSTIKENSNLFIFSNGEIDIANMSVNQDTPSKIKGFFYSKKDFLMYGVGSNIYLEGGISARRILLTGLRGKVTSSNYPTVGQQNSFINGDRVASRLTIDYDPNLIPEFIKFVRPKDTELKPTMNPPKIIKQE